MEYKTKILFTEFVTRNVRHFILEKPKGYKFIPGQATELSINKALWKDKKHPFTFTSLNEDLILEFTIKIYPKKDFPDHEGLTEELGKLIPGDELIVREPWGTINYQNSGIFLAGGAGITPFIAILRQLKKDGKISGNKLLFSNKLAKDVILEKEFREMFDENSLFLVLSREEKAGYIHGHIDEDLIIQVSQGNYSQNFYICGPKAFVTSMKEILIKLGAKSESLVFEK